VADQTRELRDVVTAIDPTLRGAVETTAERMRETLKHLHNKIIQASKKKDETLRRQFTRARELAFPAGHPQERSLMSPCEPYGPAFCRSPHRRLPGLPLFATSAVTTRVRLYSARSSAPAAVGAASSVRHSGLVTTRARVIDGTALDLGRRAAERTPDLDEMGRAENPRQFRL
jgi:hypothetical protein